MKKYGKGYTQGVFDMFHIGHLNLLNQAKEYCEELIVGVNSDELVRQYKNKKTIIAEEERKTIVQNIKAVDDAIIARTLDKNEMWEKVHFNVIFIGDDWKGNDRWKNTENQLKAIGVDVVYLSHTPGISSTDLRKVEQNAIKGV